MAQIERNEYYKELVVREIEAENIVKLAIVFVGKKLISTNYRNEEKYTSIYTTQKIKNYD